MTSTHTALFPLSFPPAGASASRPRAWLESHAPWHDVPIYEGRDLARDDLWRISQALAESKRRLARQRQCLPRARKASVSLVVAAVTAATPTLSFGHTRSPSSAGEVAKNGRRGVLELGDRGRGVQRLQRALGIAADGVFGPQTLKAVRAFQRGAGLEPDGIVGPLTRAALGWGSRAAAASGDGVLELGDRGRAVKRLQEALGIEADGIFGPDTRRAVRAFQRKAGLVADGVVGPRTRAALAERASGGQEAGHTHEAAEAPAANPGVDRRLQAALRLGQEMGLKLISAYRPGATIAASGNRSDHSYNPSRAIDMAGTPGQMRRYARAVAGISGVQTIIYSGVGMWLHGHGWGDIRSQVTYRDHVDHVHVDTF